MTAVLLPLLLAVVVAELPARRLPRSRRQRPRVSERPGSKSPATALFPVLAAAVAVRLLVPGLAGWLVATAVAVVLSLRSARGERRSPSAAAAWAANVLDLLGACLAAGAEPNHALAVTAEVMPREVAELLRPVVSALALGADARTAWGPLLDDPSWRPLARTFVRSAETGAPLATLLAERAAALRADQHSRARVAARRAGVRAVLPVGLCFLPAFLLVGVVPVVVGLLRPVLA